MGGIKAEKYAIVYFLQKKRWRSLVIHSEQLPSFPLYIEGDFDLLRVGILVVDSGGDALVSMVQDALHHVRRGFVPTPSPYAIKAINQFYILRAIEKQYSPLTIFSFYSLMAM